MKILLTLLLWMSFSTNIFGQKDVPIKRASCSFYLDLYSYFWKLDSLGNNGFRLYTYDNLIKCKLDTITESKLFLKFGKPNKIGKDETGIYYYYYYYNGESIPKEAHLAPELMYVSFWFKSGSPYLFAISEGHFD